MTNVRELLGSAINATDLTMRPGVEGSVDRVAAMGFCDATAIALIRAKIGGDHRGIERAHAHLVRALRSKATARGWKRDQVRHGVLERLATRAIWEWQHEHCPGCGGRGWVALEAAHPNGQARAITTTPDYRPSTSQPDVHQRAGIVPRSAAKRACKPCNGTGAYRHHDAERARSLGLSLDVFVKHWRSRLDAVIDQLRALDAGAQKNLTNKLERHSVPSHQSNW